MKKLRIVALLLTVVFVATLFEGCFRKGEEDPFISLRSRKARMTGLWTISEFNGDYYQKLFSGENRDIVLKQSDKSISETIEYIDMSQATQDSLQAGQDTTITWTGKVIDAYYDIRKDGTFEFAYEYTLEKTHTKYFAEGSSTFGMFAPTSNPFTIDSTMTRNYRTEYSGRWNFLDKIDGYKKRERVIFEIENARYLTNYATTYVYDFDDDDLENETDTNYSVQSFQSIIHKYANGETSMLWELNKLKNLEATLYRELDHIYNQSMSGFGSDSITATFTERRIGTETLELIQEKE